MKMHRLSAAFHGRQLTSDLEKEVYSFGKCGWIKEIPNQDLRLHSVVPFRRLVGGMYASRC